MRETYRLTTETLTVLSDNVQDIAQEMNVVDNYLHQMLAGNESDSFAKFMRLYAASVRAGKDVSPWDAAFAEVKARYRRAEGQSAPITEHLRAATNTDVAILESMEDGVIDELERRRILRAASIERNTLDVIESEVCGEIRAFARKAVASRNGRS